MPTLPPVPCTRHLRPPSGITTMPVSESNGWVTSLARCPVHSPAPLAAKPICRRPSCAPADGADAKSRQPSVPRVLETEPRQQQMVVHAFRPDASNECCSFLALCALSCPIFSSYARDSRAEAPSQLAVGADDADAKNCGRAGLASCVAEANKSKWVISGFGQALTLGSHSHRSPNNHVA